MEDAVVEGQEYAEAECAKIKEFNERVKIPSWCQDVYDWMDEDAKYLSEDCIYASLDDEHSTSTNYILRNQQVLISQIFAKNPTARVTPKQMMGDHPPGLVEFAKTLEIIAKRLTDEAGFKTRLGGAIQDVQTYGVSWLKVTTQEDLTKDPLGASRHNDQLDNIARLKTLTAQYSNGDFDDTDARYQDLQDLTNTIRTYMAGQIREDLATNPPPPVEQLDAFGAATLVPDPADPRLAQLQQLEDPAAPLEPSMLPEVPVFIGINIDAIMPQDVRFDWSITRPEDFYNAAWVAHRVYMATDDINDRWAVTDAEWASIDEHMKGRSNKSGRDHDDPSTRGRQDDEEINDSRAVWELWDKPTNRRYVWIQGMDRFLVNEVVSMTWHRFFPFFPLIFNRVTGRFLPMSDVRLQRPMQEEINTKRTHEREGQAAAYPRYMVGAGALEPEEKEKLENARPFAVVELKRPDEVKKYFENIAADPPNPLLYDTSKAIRELEISAGILQQAAGGVGGAEFATEVAVANQQMGVQSDRRRTVIEDLIRDVNECVIELALQLFPEENVRQLAGPAAVWPLVSRDHLYRQLHVNIEPGMSGKPDQAKVLEKWLGIKDIFIGLGLMPNAVTFARKIAEEMDLGVDFKSLIMDPATVAAMGPGAGGQGEQPEQGRSTPPRAPGRGAGAPTMAERSGPPAPDSVPNRPTGQTQ